MQVLTTSNITEAIDVAFVDRADIKAFIGNPGLQARACGPACSGALLKAAPFSTETEQCGIMSCIYISRNTCVNIACAHVLILFRWQIAIYCTADLYSNLYSSTLPWPSKCW